MKPLLQLLGLQRRTHHSNEDIEQTIEQIVDRTEPRIRLVPGYRKELAPAVEQALSYIDAQVSQIPPALDASPDRYAAGIRLNALFASKEELQATFAGSSELQDFFGHHSDPQAYALLCVNMKEKTVFGSALNGDVLHRDVKQIAVNFSEHKVLSPAGSEDEVRAGIKHCILEGLITHTMQHIVQLKTQKRELEDLQRILNARLRSRLSHQSGLNRLLSSGETPEESVEEIERQLAETEQKLQQMPASTEALGCYLKEVADIIGHPENYISVTLFRQQLTRMGIKADDQTDVPSNCIELAQVSIANVLEHVVAMVRFDRKDMPQPTAPQLH